MLTLNDGDDSIDYKLVELSSVAKWEVNEFLKKDIYFGTQYAPIFLAKVLSAVHANRNKNNDS